MSQTGYGKGDAVAIPFDHFAPVTGFSITPQTNKLQLTPAGTLATGTVQFPLNPADGQELSIISSQTQTAITLTAGVGDTIATAVTALVANTKYTYSYSLAGAVNSTGVVINARTWLRTQ